MQFELEESKTAAFSKNRTTIRGHTISVQPSKFAAVTPVVSRPSNNHQPSKDSSAGEGEKEKEHSVADKAPSARFNPYLSSSGAARSESIASQKRPKLRYVHPLILILFLNYFSFSVVFAA